MSEGLTACIKSLFCHFFGIAFVDIPVLLNVKCTPHFWAWCWNWVVIITGQNNPSLVLSEGRRAVIQFPLLKVNCRLYHTHMFGFGFNWLLTWTLPMHCQVIYTLILIFDSRVWCVSWLPRELNHKINGTWCLRFCRVIPWVFASQREADTWTVYVSRTINI